MSENAPTPAPLQTRAPRWMWIVLVLSLALNLLVLGTAAGAIWHFRHGHPFHDRGPDGLSRYLATLPEERRGDIAALIEAERAKTRDLRRLSREKRREAARAFEAEPFDAARLEAVAREASQARIELIRQRELFFTELARKLTAEERRAYLEWRHERRRGWHHRHGRWHDRDELRERGEGGERENAR